MGFVVEHGSFYGTLPIPWYMWYLSPPPEQNNRPLWKNYLPATSLAGSKNTTVCSYLSLNSWKYCWINECGYEMMKLPMNSFVEGNEVVADKQQTDGGVITDFLLYLRSLLSKLTEIETLNEESLSVSASCSLVFWRFFAQSLRNNLARQRNNKQSLKAPWSRINFLSESVCFRDRH